MALGGDLADLLAALEHPEILTVDRALQLLVREVECALRMVASGELPQGRGGLGRRRPRLGIGQPSRKGGESRGGVRRGPLGGSGQGRGQSLQRHLGRAHVVEHGDLGVVELGPHVVESLVLAGAVEACGGAHGQDGAAAKGQLGGHRNPVGEAIVGPLRQHPLDHRDLAGQAVEGHREHVHRDQGEQGRSGPAVRRLKLHALGVGQAHQGRDLQHAGQGHVVAARPGDQESQHRLDQQRQGHDEVRAMGGQGLPGRQARVALGDPQPQGQNQPRRNQDQHQGSALAVGGQDQAAEVERLQLAQHQDQGDLNPDQKGDRPVQDLQGARIARRRGFPGLLRPAAGHHWTTTVIFILGWMPQTT